MTTVITRLYADAATAERIAEQLRWQGFPSSALRVISGKGTHTRTAKERLLDVHVPDGAADTYAKKVEGGNAVLVVLATYRPLGAARIAREALANSATIPSGVKDEETYVKETPKTEAPKILKEHPLFLTMKRHPGDYRPGTVSSEIGIPLLSPRRPKSDSVMSGGRYMSKSFWPMPLVSSRKPSGGVMKGGRHVSRAFWPMPLVTTKPPKRSVIPGGDLPLSRAMRWPTILR